jgi:hypothetical protein
MFRLLELKSLWFPSLVCAGLCFFSSCATEEDVEPDSARFNIAFAPPLGGDSLKTFYDGDSLVWKIDQALLCVGEIGIHWSRIIAQSTPTGSALAKAAQSKTQSHDIPKSADFATPSPFWPGPSSVFRGKTSHSKPSPSVA